MGGVKLLVAGIMGVVNPSSVAQETDKRNFTRQAAHLISVFFPLWPGL